MNIENSRLEKPERGDRVDLKGPYTLGLRGTSCMSEDCWDSNQESLRDGERRSRRKLTMVAEGATGATEDPGEEKEEDRHGRGSDIVVDAGISGEARKRVRDAG